MSVQVQEETRLVCGRETQRGILNIQKLGNCMQLKGTGCLPCLSKVPTSHVCQKEMACSLALDVCSYVLPVLAWDEGKLHPLQHPCHPGETEKGPWFGLLLTAGIS